MTAPATSISDLAHQLGVSIVDADRALRALEAKGLVGRLPGAGHRFRATPPAEAFRPLVRRRRAELRTMRADIEALTDVYNAAPVGEPIEVLAGPADPHVNHLLSTAVMEVCALVVLPSERQPTPHRSRVPEGVPIRVVYPRWFLGDEAGRARITAAERVGGRVRVADRPPFPLLVIDRSVALIRTRTEDIRDAALLVHAGGLHDALMAMFERTWAVAERLPSHADHAEYPQPGPSPDDLRLLGLLLDGLTDEAIAGKLDVGTRTVQRRVHDMIEMAGVRTRLQLIWYATRNGWV